MPETSEVRKRSGATSAASDAEPAESTDPKSPSQSATIISEPTDRPAPPAETVHPRRGRTFGQTLFAWWFPRRRTVGLYALCAAIVGCAVEWPLYMELEETLWRPMLSFVGAFAVSAVIAIAAGLSPSMSPYEGSTYHWLKLGGVWLILGNVYVTFGMVGPNGALTMAGLLGTAICWR